ncbi:MAG: polyprenyl synthetase family protein [Alphaproteobacteria bacterium]
MDRAHARKPAVKPSLDGLLALVGDDLKRVNQLIVDNMDNPVPLIPQLAGHLIAAGGKRLRPILTLASARLCGYRGDRHLGLAACVEFIHSATLLHDDVVDESKLRRGLDTANAVWGNQASVLVGDFLFSRAFQLMVADGSLEVLEILSNASAVIAQGEVHQLATANNLETTIDDYMTVIRSKTATLFAAAAAIGAVVADRPAVERDALHAYGMNLGIAFQLVDDYLDYAAAQELLGKTVGDDFHEGKMTLPVVLAVERADDADRAFWRRTLEELDQRDDDLPRAMVLLQACGALDDTLVEARRFGEEAGKALSIFPDSPTRRELLAVIDFCVARSA